MMTKRYLWACGRGVKESNSRSKGHGFDSMLIIKSKEGNLTLYFI